MSYISRRVSITLRNVSTADPQMEANCPTHLNRPDSCAGPQIQDPLRVCTDWRVVQPASPSKYTVMEKIQALQFNLGQRQMP
jgi:hypothetical protein